MNCVEHCISRDRVVANGYYLDTSSYVWLADNSHLHDAYRTIIRVMRFSNTSKNAGHFGGSLTSCTEHYVRRGFLLCRYDRIRQRRSNPPPFLLPPSTSPRQSQTVTGEARNYSKKAPVNFINTIFIQKEAPAKRRSNLPDFRAPMRRRGGGARDHHAAYEIV